MGLSSRHEQAGGVTHPPVLLRSARALRALGATVKGAAIRPRYIANPNQQQVVMLVRFGYQAVGIDLDPEHIPWIQ